MKIKRRNLLGLAFLFSLPFLLSISVICTTVVLGDWSWKKSSNMMMGPPPKQIHVHHFDGGMSNHGMSGNYMKGHGSSSSGGGLIELLLLSSLLGNGGLFGNGNTGVVQQAAVPVQVPVVG